MPSTKNLSPRQLSALTAGLLALPISIGIYILTGNGIVGAASLPQKSIDEVREDVEKWGEKRNEEIEMLKKNEAYRKEFLQNLAHEFKTPIFAIQGYVDTLLGGAMDDVSVRKKFLENAAKNVDRLVNLMNDLDEISRLERGEQLLYKQNF